MANKSLELDPDHGAGLHVFDLSWKTSDVKRFYNHHANQYDKEVVSIFPGGASTVQTLLEVVGKDYQNMRVLDVAAGTGVLGAHLKKQGFMNVDGLDLSEKMLEKAKEKNIYKNYIVASITDKPLDIPRGTYDAITSCGAISCGLIAPGAFEEMCRLTRPGGYICFTVRIDAYDEEKNGFGKKMQELTDKRKWQEVRKFLTQYYEDSKLVHQKKCYIFCFKVLEN